MSDVYVVRLSRERFIELSQWVSIEGRPEHPERQKLLEEIARAAHIFLNCSMDITQKSSRKQLCEVVDRLRSLEGGAPTVDTLRQRIIDNAHYD